MKKIWYKVKDSEGKWYNAFFDAPISTQRDLDTAWKIEAERVGVYARGHYMVALDENAPLQRVQQLDSTELQRAQNIYVKVVPSPAGYVPYHATCSGMITYP